MAWAGGRDHTGVRAGECLLGLLEAVADAGFGDDVARLARGPRDRPPIARPDTPVRTGWCAESGGSSSTTSTVSGSVIVDFRVGFRQFRQVALARERKADHNNGARAIGPIASDDPAAHS